jgi:hypothetical protein
MPLPPPGHLRTLLAAAVTALALTLGLASAVQAQSDIPSDKREAIERLIALMDLDQMAEQTAAAMEQQMVAAIRQSNPNFPEEAMQIVVDTFNEESRTFVNQSFDEIPGIMAKYYTTQEIDEIIAFYETPVGQKSLEVMPQLTQEIQSVMIPKAQVFQQEVVAKIQQNLQEAGY